MRVWAVVFFLAFALQAQVIVTNSGGPFVENTTPAVPRQPSRPEDMATVEGQVVNAVTGAPVKKATVLLNRTDFAPGAAGMLSSYSTTTDAAGNYAMKDVEPGKYRVMVTRNGFLTMNYGAHSPSRGGTPLTIDRAQHVKDVNFRLTPHGVVTGRIVDEDGEPVPYAMVQLQTMRYQQGKRQLSQAGGASTNDLGEYRLFGIAPGKYYLSVTWRQGMGIAAQAEDRSANKQPEEDYVATYYPGTTNAANAVQIDIGAGSQVAGINLTVLKGRTYHLRGRVAVTVGLPSRRNMPHVLLVPSNTAGYVGGIRSNRVDPSTGNFDIRGVAPGVYSLYANVNEDGKQYSARLSVNVGSSDVENLVLTLAGGADVTGTLRVESGDKPDLAGITVHLQAQEMGGIMFSAPATGRVKADGSFTLPNAGADAYYLVASGLPDGYFVKSIRSGQVDVLANGLDLTAGPPQPLDIVISPKAGTVSGTVQNPGTGQPASGATVVLIPQEKERHEQQQYYRTAVTDQSGSYTVKNIVPGEYRVFAWEDLEYGAYMDPDFLKPVESQGQSITVQESDRKTLALTMIPADASAGAQQK